MTSHANHRRGLTRHEVIALIVLLVIIVAIIVPLVIGGGWGRGNMAEARRRARVLRDSVYMKEIGEGLEAYAGEQTSGQYPVPGLINRALDPFTGGQLPNQGPEDPEVNTTANFYSAIVMQNYVLPDILVSNQERNPLVVEDDDYDFSLWDPAGDVYWDEAFVADLATGSNASFAHRPLVSSRGRDLRWRNTQASTLLLGTRGPDDPVASAASLSCLESGMWRGALLFGDGHVEITDIPAGSPITSAGMMGARPHDREREGDDFISFTLKIEGGPRDFRAVFQTD